MRSSSGLRTRGVATTTRFPALCTNDTASFNPCTWVRASRCEHMPAHVPIHTNTHTHTHTHAGISATAQRPITSRKSKMISSSQATSNAASACARERQSTVTRAPPSSATCVCARELRECVRAHVCVCVCARAAGVGTQASIHHMDAEGARRRPRTRVHVHSLTRAHGHIRAHNTHARTHARTHTRTHTHTHIPGYTGE